VERRRTRNHDALVAAARRLFAQDGFEATTIAAISQAADLGFGTFYRYFADKEAALEAVLEDGRAAMDALLLAVEPAGTPAAVAVSRLSERFVRAVRRDRDILTLMWEVAMRKVATHRPLSLNAIGPELSLPALLAGAIERIVTPAIARGELADADPQLVSRLIAAAHMYLLTPPGFETDEGLVIKTLREFELRALGAPEEGAGPIPLRRSR
jgi:AcrR family transcriptional regulator